ncbi:hypothetical protein [Neisseria iguanae]|uniref:DUF4124 domain-containing protein n=1 Tax=Neisseria iguanae TaxID=90242 RepID=A0A2P7TYX9_9NEIS|nr:hypothetical protein [Neisseria iguanae]PSJ79932.1 hypothetical protein C7N83_09295 [Neisseria iguanae]
MKYPVLNTCAAILGLLAIPAEAASKIYTCETNGTVVYTSRLSGDCHAPDLPPIGRYSSARYDAPEMVVSPEQRKAAKPANNTNQSTSRVVGTKGKTPVAPIRPTTASAAAPAPKSAAGNSRRAILETELSNERRALSEAQKSLAQARAVKGGTIDHQQIKNLEGLVLDRQQNIQALQRELGRM